MGEDLSHTERILVTGRTADRLSSGFLQPREQDREWRERQWSPGG